MGLDGVEFVMAVEEVFGLAIPDEDAQNLFTPGHVVRYLEARLPSGSGACLDQRAFHAVRRAAMNVLGRPRRDFRPTTRWDAVLPAGRRRRTWTLLHHATGLLPWPPMWWWGIRADCATLGGTARYLATHAAGALQPPQSGWSRAQIESTISRLMEEYLAIDEFKWDDRFVDDLGVK